MRRLILLRHSKAAREAGGGDRERPLTKRGREDAMRVGSYLVENKLIPNLAVVSDSRRTRETLDCVLTATGRHFKTLIDPSLYLAEAAVLLAELHKTPDIVHTMLVICHNPGLADFAERISGQGNPAGLALMALKYPTSGLSLINFGETSWSEIQWGQGRLERFVTPATLVEGLEDLD